MEPIVLYRREWGDGQPVIAMHPLGLESSAFEGFGMVLARHGMRTIAVDLPGFGRTPMPAVPLTPAAMAEPVIELARSLERPPVVLGISMGGRVALEAALTAPDAFLGVISIAPYLPWLRYRLLMDRAWVIDPRIADWMPLEHAWPVLRWLARALETLPYLRARAAPRVPQLLLPCLGHWVNGPHHRCLAATVAGLVTGMLTGAVLEPDLEDASGVCFVTSDCIAGRTASAVPALGASHGA